MYGSIFDRGLYNVIGALNELDRAFGNGDSMPAVACRTDIIEAEDKYILEAELPGFEKDEINLDINGDLLVITAEHKAEENAEEIKYIRRERNKGSYKRSFDISDVDAENIDAEYKNGILAITLPKKKPAEPLSKSVDIKF
ncbi:MAG: Hsp20/alpha crystallin family protein [Ruminococcus sp.]|nr:Hsp20/alpha crystallin family protein [Ruminococcus sp.]